jgi:hypothetical protein
MSEGMAGFLLAQLPFSRAMLAQLTAMLDRQTISPRRRLLLDRECIRATSSITNRGGETHMAVIDFPTRRNPAEAQSETLVALLDATLAARVGDIESAQQNILKAQTTLRAWDDALG